MCFQLYIINKQHLKTIPFSFVSHFSQIISEDFRTLISSHTWIYLIDHLFNSLVGIGINRLPSYKCHQLEIDGWSYQIAIHFFSAYVDEISHPLISGILYGRWIFRTRVLFIFTHGLKQAVCCWQRIRKWQWYWTVHIKNRFCIFPHSTCHSRCWDHAITNDQNWTMHTEFLCD